MDNVIFIGGTGRCGTNILKDLFNYHPSVYTLPFEHRIFVDPDGVFDFYKSYPDNWTPFVASRRIKRLITFLDSLKKDTFLHGVLGKIISKLKLPIAPKSYCGWELEKWIPNYEHITECFIDQLVYFSYDAIYPGSESYEHPTIVHAGSKSKKELKTIVRTYILDLIKFILWNKSEKYFVEDNTWNIFYAQEIQEILPEAKIIHIYRDPRDVVASFMKQRWCPHRMILAIEYYKSLMNRWFGIKNKLEHECISVKFEELINKPKDTMSDLFYKCNIPVTDIDLIYNTDFISKEVPLLFQNSHIGRWLDLKQIDQDLLNFNLQPYVEIFEYDN